MSIIMFAIIGHELHVTNTLYWVAFGAYGAIKIGVWLFNLVSLTGGKEENTDD